MNQKLKASLFILLIFIVGVITGILLDNFIPFLSYEKHWGPGFFKRIHKSRYCERIIEDLNFAPEQEDLFKQAMERHSKRMRTLFENNRPQMKQSWDLLMADFDSFLTKDQRNQLEERLKQRRRFRVKQKKSSDSSDVKLQN